jgi:signal transduction histidine kinase
MQPRHSIRLKLRRILLLTSVAVLFLAVATLVTYEIFAFRRSHLEVVSSVAQVLADNATSSLSFDDQNDAAKVLSTLRSEKTVRLAVLYDANGKIFAYYPASTQRSMLPANPGPDRAKYQGGLLIVVKPVKEQTRFGTLYLESDLTPLYARLQVYGAIVLVVLGCSVLLAFLLSLWAQKRITAPILALAEVASAVSERKDYSVRAQKQTDDEIGSLTEAFNEMLMQISVRDAALQQSSENLRQAHAELERRVESRTAELAESNRELEAFTYSVSHDLRAPLRHINAYAQMLEEEYAKTLNAEAQKYLARIRAGAKNMGMLVDDLLNLARIGRQELTFQTVPLNQLLDDLLGDMKQETAARTIDWRIEDLGSAQCDPGLIKQVFANLLSNAIKYTRPRSVATIWVGRKEEKGQTIYFVRDNGVGFNVKYAAKLFGVFQRLHRAEDFEGTGVGLATVERIIRKHGGRIWAEAELDKGATFYFTLGHRKF